MSEATPESSVPPADPAAAPAKGTRPARVRGPLPPPAESPASLKLRKRIMLWMLITSVVLTGLIGVRLYQKFSGKARSYVNVEEESEAAYEKAKDASREFLSVEGRAARAEAALPAAELEPLKAQLTVLEESHEKLKSLLDLIHERRLDNTPASEAIVKKWLQIKFWILDAGDFLESAKEAPKYAGFNFRIQRLQARAQVAHQELKKLETTKAELQGGAEAKARTDAIARLKEIETVLGSCAEEFGLIEDYVKTGLARPDLTAGQIPDLEPLRDETTKANMGRQAARNLRSQIAP